MSFGGVRLRGVVYLNTSSPKYYPFSVFLNFFSAVADARRSFTISYLIDNWGFSPELARRAAKRVSLISAEKPDSVIAFFKNHGFSNSQLQSIIRRAPELLACDTNKRVLPKFQFLASKGASQSHIVLMVTRTPAFLRYSLKNLIIPSYELIRTFCPSDVKAITYITSCPASIGDARVESNVKILLDAGFTPSSIHHLLRTRISILCSSGLTKAIEEVKGLGFDPSALKSSVALLAKKAMKKSQWDAKIDIFKKWGWSEDEVVNAFRKHPNFMLRSVDKLNAVTSFWVNKLGWDRSVLLTSPEIFGYSLEKRIIPRALIVQYLLSKGLMSKDASLVSPFCKNDKMFLEKFVKPFAGEEEFRQLMLYRGEYKHLTVS